jgi:transposase
MIADIMQGAEHIHLACGHVDFRKQIEGLCSLVSLQFSLDPYSPTCVFLFCNKRRNCIKVLRFDQNGFLLVTKKLLGDMSFQWPKEPGEVKDITLQASTMVIRWALY